MNILAAKRTQNASYAVAFKGNNAPGLASGQVYEGLITAKNKEKISIKLEDGFSFEAKVGSINKNVGESIKFMASKDESGTLTLRVLDFSANKNTDGFLSPCQTKDLLKQSGFITEESIHESGLNSGEAQAEEKARLAAAKIQSKLAYASDNLTMHAINELLANGVSVTKLNLSMLNSVIKQVKESPQALSEQEVDKIINESIKEHGIDAKELESKTKIIKSLSENSLSINSNNVEFVEKCLKIYEESAAVTDSAIAGLIKSGGEITLSALYSSNHTAAIKNESADMELLNKDLPRLLAGMGIDDNSQTREAASLLFAYDLPITEENMEKVAFLKDFASQGEEQVRKSAANAIKEGIKPENAVLTDFAGKENLSAVYREIMEFLPTATNRQVAYINSVNMPMTLFNLRNTAVPETFTPQAQSGDSRYMLIQLQHKLTNEAAQRLIGKGINIDTMPVNKALNELKAAENENFTAFLDDMGAEANTQNITGLAQTMEAVRGLKYIIPDTYRRVAEGAVELSVAGISPVGRKADVLERIEELMPVPNYAYGDSLDKAEDSLKKIVESMGFAADEMNMKSASILVKSGMELNRDNMLKVGIIDLKISNVYENLHPKAAAHMIKSGFDPLNSHIDSVIDYIESYNSEYGENPKDSVAQTIYQMDKKGQLNDNERKALIALYKMMDKIEKDSFTSVGLNLRAGHMPTLRSFMDMTDLKIDKTQEISDSGYTESLISDTGNALKQISSPNIDHEEEYAKLIMKSFAGKINRENLEKLVSDPSIMDKPLEKIVDFVLESAEDSKGAVNGEEALAAFNDLKTVLGQKHDLFTFFENIGIPATVNNIKTYLALREPGYFSSTITDIADEIDKNAADYSVNLENIDITAENQPNAAIVEAADNLEQAAVDSGKADMIKEIRLLQNAVKVQNAIAKRQNNFKIPVDIGGKAGQLNMFMPNGYVSGASKINLAVSINTEAVSVSAMFLVEGNSAGITLDIKGYDARSKRDIEKKLNTALESFGMKGKITAFEATEDFSGNLDILPEIGKNHKEAMFNIGKAMMKFADSISK